MPERCIVAPPIRISMLCSGIPMRGGRFRKSCHGAARPSAARSRQRRKGYKSPGRCNRLALRRSVGWRKNERNICKNLESLTRHTEKPDEAAGAVCSHGAGKIRCRSPATAKRCSTAKSNARAATSRRSSPSRDARTVSGTRAAARPESPSRCCASPVGRGVQHIAHLG